MGLREWLGFSPAAPAQPMQQSATLPIYDLVPEGMSLDEYLISRVMSKSVEQLWREQPHLRTVVGFISRNIAQLGLHVFERDADDGRNRQRDSALARLLDEPNDDTTTFELIEATVASRCLYDETFWYVGLDNNARSGWTIRHIPTPWVIGKVGAGAFGVQAYKVSFPGAPAGKWVEVPAADVVVFRGWNPTDPISGVSPVLALKAILAEQIHAQVFRDQMWSKGGRVGNWIYRPPPGQGAGTAPQWSPTARDKWIQQYGEKYSGDLGDSAGGTPLFEDGMELRSSRFSAKDEQFVESSKLALSTVAQVYFVNPTMVGLLDNANYSNVREFRRALYGDNLGPEIERLQQRINRKVVPRVGNPDVDYVEFNLQTKLAGSFEEQGSILQTAIGAPWMTVNEGRAKQNMSAIEGGDELIRPLNVTAPGDQDPVEAEPEPDASTLPTTDPAVPPGDDEGEKHGTRRINGVHVRL